MVKSELARNSPATGPRVLVTGGTGFLGRPVVRRLVADGYQVRVLARTLAKAAVVQGFGAEVCAGDVADLDSFGRAVAGCEMVVHLAAGTSGSEKDSESATIRGTRNLLTLCTRHGLKRVVYISSCGVYGVADYTKNARVTESAGLERFPERRGSYTASKLAAEGLVKDFMQSAGIPTVILRPGTIYGPGGEIYTQLMGFAIGSLYIVIGTGRFTLPIVYVDNLVDAVVMSLEKSEAVGHVFNVVDPERIDKRTYMELVVRRINPRARVIYFPYSLLYGITWLQERAFRAMKRAPVLSCYRLASSQTSVEYDSSLISSRLGWRAKVSVADAINRLVASTLSKDVASGVQGSIPPVASPGTAEPDSAG